VVLLGAIFPRFALVLVEMFSDWNDRAFDSFWIGFVGWLFLPYTTLSYTAMNAWGDPINGFGWMIVILGFAADLAGWFGSGAQRRR
jgi:hypothetical protein